MAGDPRNPKTSLLKKYDIPIDHISYDYIEKCTEKKELERIVRILRSGEEGFFPDLLKATEERLRLYAPDSRVLRQETAILTKESLSSDEWKAVESDLLDWEEEMKVINKSLDFEKGRIDTVGNKNLPSIRKIVEPNLKPKPNEKKLITNTKNERIKSGDYKAWDKFDVDKELLKIDVEEERKKEESEKKKREFKKMVTEKKVEIDIDKDSYSSMEQQILASQAKDRGNECYKSGDLTNALKYYDLSIKFNPTSVAFNNRAMTHLKLKQYDNAVNDCNVVLSKDKFNIKALHRRATAYQEMAAGSNDYNMLALQDLNEIILLEPNNKVAQSELQKLMIKTGMKELGKKFRMTIDECDQDTNRNAERDFFKRKELSNVKENFKNVDSLPLTYYGPSTSTFQCEPYSTTHRSLSGSFLSTEILCKCSSKRLRQNPLCQKCGEEVSTPKPCPKISSAKAKIAETNRNEAINKETEKMIEKSESSVGGNRNGEGIVPVAEPEAEARNDAGKSEAVKKICNEVSASGAGKEIVSAVENGKLEPEASDRNSNANANENKSAIKTENSFTADETVRLINNKSGLDGKDLGNSATVSREANESGQNERLEKSEVEGDEKTTSGINEMAQGEVIGKSAKAEEIRSSGPTDLKSKTVPKSNFDGSSPAELNNSKAKKKKKSKGKKENRLRKQLELIEPVKVVHAAKYINPTSVEPKPEAKPKKPEVPESNHVNRNQFKAFVPNRQCLSVRREEESGSSASSPSRNLNLAKPTSDEMKKSFSYSEEGNKENVLKSDFNFQSGNGIPDKVNSTKETKAKESCDSAYEFVKTWEELKKLDPSYAKRAEIIRLLKPADLGKVIGIKMDSDMLSSILECLEKQFIRTDPEVVVEFLKQLPEIPRFGLIKMFLAEKDVKIMRNLIDTAESKGFILEEDVKKALSVIS